MNFASEGIKHFKAREFDSPDLPGSGTKMEPGLVKLVDQLRSEVGFPLLISSGFRTTRHNLLTGGIEGSSHTTGWACDIRALHSATRFTIVNAALALGFSRIGLADTFIHVDVDPTKVEKRIWLY